jgi:hypothetical protein
VEVRSSDVFLKEDLRALLKSYLYLLRVTEGTEDFKKGYFSALFALATALNLKISDFVE